MPFYNVKNITIETGISVLREATAKKHGPPGAIKSAGAFRLGRYIRSEYSGQPGRTAI